MLLEGHSETGPFKFAQLQQRYANGEIEGDVLCFPKTVFGALSWRPLRYYFPEFDRTAANENHKDTGTTNGSRPTALFRCCNCNVELRVALLPGSIRCPQCRASYIYLRGFDALCFPHRSASFDILDSSLSTAPVPQAGSASGEICAHYSRPRRVTRPLVLARKAYRKIVQSYHPDKVAHLGPELRRVAEAKTKELNTAISVVEEFLNSQ